MAGFSLPAPIDPRETSDQARQKAPRSLFRVDLYHPRLRRRRVTFRTPILRRWVWSERFGG